MNPQVDVREWINNNILFFDGAMGTMLQKRGLATGGLPEIFNITCRETVIQIHRDYVHAGADVVTTNTFQAHEHKLQGISVEDVIAAGVQCARKSGARFVALGIGPLGRLMAPLGAVSFQQAYNEFRRQMIAGEASGCDLVIIETISDLYEAKAAILAAKENTGLPVFCTMTFQEDGRTFLGCCPLTAVITLQGLGVDALGVNCSLGPNKIGPIVETMLKYSHIPIIVQANAGLPIYRGGEAHYEMPPEQYADWASKMVKSGVRIVGGCCGTTPEHIGAIKKRLGGNFIPAVIGPLRVSACTSGSSTVILDDSTTEIGERLNPTGKKKLQTALRSGDMAYLINEAMLQVEAGAQILDVNVGLPGLDEPAVMEKVIRELQNVIYCPLQIDSSNVAAIESALRVYNGKPIINSVSGKRESMEQIFPLAKKYGALIVGLTLDESGIPATAQGRLAIARRIRDTAISYGIGQEDLLIDCLVLTASAQQGQVKETLAAIRLVKSELGLKTVLGVSNVSFGLPEREIINGAFLAAALGAGLDAAILNPMSVRYREVLDAYRVLNNEDKNAQSFIEKYTREKAAENVTLPHGPLSLFEIITQGRKDETESAVSEMLKTATPVEIIDNEFIPALNAVGKQFELGGIFLPELMLSAQAVQSGFKIIQDHMRLTGQKRAEKGRILMATVHGDIHDIGKNIVVMLLESYGYEILDLGKDVPAEAVIDAIRDNNIQLVGLSALMTTTVSSMKDTIAKVREAGLAPTFFVGGAVLNPEYAKFVGAEYYAKDAMEGVKIAERFFAKTKRRDLP